MKMTTKMTIKKLQQQIVMMGYGHAAASTLRLSIPLNSVELNVFNI